MKQTLFFFLITVLITSCHETKTSANKEDFTTRFESSLGTETPTYEEVILWYQKLAEAYPTVSMYEMGETDSGKPLHVVIYDPDAAFSMEYPDKAGKNILLVNNGIHPGESDGIDASMLLLRDLAQGKLEAPKKTLLAVIPIYNIGGALNRNTGTRTNQNGPKEYGFRGNARNYDLNRDFIKADTKNARSFAQLFHLLNPEWFIDNHVSNGADYQYVLTHLFTQHDKLGGALGNYLHENFMPKFVDSLSQKKWGITPYVNVFNKTPEQGFSQFMDYPRYSTGYTTLFNTFGMMVETHMLKPYKQRVEGTYELMKTFISLAEMDASLIKQLRSNQEHLYEVGTTYPVSWKLDSTKNTILQFKGYEGTMEPSPITGSQRLKYHRDRPFEKPVTYYDYFIPSETITIPSQYIVPKGYWNIVEQLRNNNIAFRIVEKDTVISAEVYHVKDYQTYKNAYEGHYPHYNTQVEMTTEQVSVKKGDYLVDTQQPGVRYLLETLEPMAMDSFFNWNYFDTVLQQKEGFSPYVWEDMALEFLNHNPYIKKAFEEKKNNDSDFAQDWYWQLDWIHKQSPNFEASYLRYPIVRVHN